MSKVKTYIANSVMLFHVEDRFRASNNNCQFTIVCRATSQKRVAELLGVSLSCLRNFNGIHEAGPSHQSIAKEDEVVYYRVDHTKYGYIGKWFAYMPTVEFRAAALAEGKEPSCAKPTEGRP